MDETPELQLIKDTCNAIHFEFESKLNDYELQVAQCWSSSDSNDQNPFGKTE